MKVYPAGGALIGPAAHVGPHVDEEARVLREGLAAPDALLGLLPSVRSLMDDQAVPTLWATLGPLSRVASVVFNEA